MTKKLSLSLVIVLVALVISAASFLTIGQVAKGGEASCGALLEAKARGVKTQRALDAIDKALALNSCSGPVGPNCAEADFAMPGFNAQCYVDFTTCATDPLVAVCLEPSPTCDAQLSTPTGQASCGVLR